ncbi:hypothetical protein Y032_0224g2714 [Ancylostoma ceylanicum]|nr:hypothetical protein Y032_0224g2714 [Ancylostoma ceylanicum]
MCCSAITGDPKCLCLLKSGRDSEVRSAASRYSPATICPSAPSVHHPFASSAICPYSLQLHRQADNRQATAPPTTDKPHCHRQSPSPTAPPTTSTTTNSRCNVVKCELL